MYKCKCTYTWRSGSVFSVYTTAPGSFHLSVEFVHQIVFLCVLLESPLDLNDQSEVTVSCISLVMNRKYRSRELPPLPPEEKRAVKPPGRDGLAGFVDIACFTFFLICWIYNHGWTLHYMDMVKNVAYILVLCCYFRMAEFDACKFELLVTLIEGKPSLFCYIITSKFHTVCWFSLYWFGVCCGEGGNLNQVYKIIDKQFLYSVFEDGAEIAIKQGEAVL